MVIWLIGRPWHDEGNDNDAVGSNDNRNSPIIMAKGTIVWVLALARWVNYYMVIFENFPSCPGDFNYFFEKKLKSLMFGTKLSIVDWIQLYLPDDWAEFVRDSHKYALEVTASQFSSLSKWSKSHHVDYGLILFSLLIGLLLFYMVMQLIKVFGSVIRFSLKVTCVLLISFFVYYTLSEGLLLMPR